MSRARGVLEASLWPPRVDDMAAGESIETWLMPPRSNVAIWTRLFTPVTSLVLTFIAGHGATSRMSTLKLTGKTAAEVVAALKALSEEERAAVTE